MGIDDREPDLGFALPPNPVTRLPGLEPIEEARSERLERDAARFPNGSRALAEAPRPYLSS